MKAVKEFLRILIFRGQIDFRKRRRSLAAVVHDELKEDPFSSTLFVFFNKKRDCVRALYWDKTGFAMWEKELEKDRFPWQRSMPKIGAIAIEPQQAEWLLDGVDIWKLKPHEELKYTTVF